jgi:hypothetical protein
MNKKPEIAGLARNDEILCASSAAFWVQKPEIAGLARNDAKSVLLAQAAYH